MHEYLPAKIKMPYNKCILWIITIQSIAAFIKESDFADGNFTWSYENSNEWPEHYLYCGGLMQSPIDVVSNTTVAMNLSSYTLEEYPDNYTIMNDGISLEVLSKTYLGGVKGGYICGEYRIDNLHFHWGSNSSVGSEHTINGIHYPLELHVLSYRQIYPSHGESTYNRYDLNVIGFLFQLVNESNNKGLEIITSRIDDLNKVQVGEQLDLENFNLSLLIPMTVDKYYAYEGSFTVPPCLEIVKWTLSKEILGVTEDQLEKFRSLSSNRANHLHQSTQNIAKNHRDTQKLNKRTVVVKDDAGEL